MDDISSLDMLLIINKNSDKTIKVLQIKLDIHQTILCFVVSSLVLLMLIQMDISEEI